MNILIIDPSSTKSGYAILDDQSAKLIDAGVLTPNRTRDDPNARIVTMADELLSLIREYGVRLVVIEDTSGHVGWRHGGRGAGLAVYGKAIGVFYAKARELVGAENVHMILENTWTRGRRKSSRAAMVGYVHGQLSGDRGHDAADAIGLGEWFINSRRNTHGKPSLPLAG